MKTRTTAFVIFCFLIPGSCISQKEPGVKNDLKISLFFPGLGYDSKISRSSTVNIFACITFAARLPAKGSETGKFFDPTFSVQYRIYNPFDRSFSLDHIIGESAWYLFGGYKNVLSRKPLSYYQIEKKRRSVNVIGIGAGIQRLGEKRFFFDTGIGPAYRFAQVTTNDDPLNYRPYHKMYAEVIFSGQISVGFYLGRIR